ncbi:MAG: Fatty acid synthesis protein, partial [Chloroflexota bacterium]|nr:Fatty acid synthesis protein [Chloroflexota bacterium]
MDLSAVRRVDVDSSIRIAVDAMGGDHAPDEVV